MQNQQKDSVKDAYSSNLISPVTVCLKPKDIQILFQELTLQSQQTCQTEGAIQLEVEQKLWDEDNLETESQQEDNSKRTYRQFCGKSQKKASTKIFEIISTASRRQIYTKSDQKSDVQFELDHKIRFQQYVR